MRFAYLSFFLCSYFFSFTILESLHAQEAPRESAPSIQPLASPSLPTPPQQSEPWTPPQTNLPNAVLSTAKVLFEQGMADPRGCDYREVELLVGVYWNGPRTAKTHAWVLPPQPNEPPSAICWNGWVYPVLSIGDPQSLKKDITEVVEADKAREAKHNAERPHLPYVRRTVAAAEGWTTGNLSGVGVCLLLRAGHNDLAQQMYERLTTAKPEPTSDPYLLWATDWLWGQFIRSVDAFNQGNDNLALLGARELQRVHPLVEAEATKRGFKRFPYDDTPRRNQLQPHVTFLNQVPELVADLERRVNDNQPPQFLPVERLNRDELKSRAQELATQPVESLIAQLEDVRGVKWGEPGGISWELVPTVAAIIEKGAPMVPALLDAWENDKRLTRTLDSSRSFHRNRTIIPVSTVVRISLSGILEIRFNSVAEARSWWNENKGVSPEERWYDTLRDDAAGKDQWLQAASRIVQPQDVRTTVSGWTITPGQRTEESRKPRGESLRSKTNPSVLDLMAIRAEQISQQGEPGTRQMWAIRDACKLALMAARWDQKASVPLLTEQFLRTQDFLDKADSYSYSHSYDDDLGPILADLTIARVNGDDSDLALKDFSTFILKFNPQDASSELDKYFEPLWSFPNHPTTKSTAQKLFLHADSPWNPILQRSGRVLRGSSILNSPMLGVDAFRQQLLTQLRDTSSVGTFYYNEQRNQVLPFDPENDDLTPKTAPQFDASLAQQLRWAYAVLDTAKADPNFPTDGRKIDLRVCDIYAVALSKTEGMPWVAWYWPTPQRDAARLQLIARLEQYGHRYQDKDLDLPGGSPFNTIARLTFEKLDHPATAADVAQGKAIFSLEGEGERRLVENFTVPTAAKWPALKERPYQQQSYNPTTKESRLEVAYRQEGLIWQAEEALKDGKWTRYYGFIAPDALTKVPAEDLILIDKTDNHTPPRSLNN